MATSVGTFWSSKSKLVVKMVVYSGETFKCLLYIEVDFLRNLRVFQILTVRPVKHRGCSNKSSIVNLLKQPFISSRIFPTNFFKKFLLLGFSFFFSLGFTSKFIQKISYWI